MAYIYIYINDDKCCAYTYERIEGNIHTHAHTYIYIKRNRGWSGSEKALDVGTFRDRGTLDIMCHHYMYVCLLYMYLHKRHTRGFRVCKRGRRYIDTVIYCTIIILKSAILYFLFRFFSNNCFYTHCNLILHYDLILFLYFQYYYIAKYNEDILAVAIWNHLNNQNLWHTLTTLLTAV